MKKEAQSTIRFAYIIFRGHEPEVRFQNIALPDADGGKFDLAWKHTWSGEEAASSSSHECFITNFRAAIHIMLQEIAKPVLRASFPQVSSLEQFFAIVFDNLVTLKFPKFGLGVLQSIQSGTNRGCAERETTYIDCLAGRQTVSIAVSCHTFNPLLEHGGPITKPIYSTSRNRVSILPRVFGHLLLA